MSFKENTYKTQINLKSLQILRAIAALSVVYYHINAAPHFGKFGVDIFFIISGFVMSMIIENGQKPYTFVVNRITRIVPLYWVLTLCLFILSAIKPDLLDTTTANIFNFLKSIFFVPYFKESGQLHPMLVVGWTLNYEMFFYFCLWVSIIVMITRKIYALITIFLLTIFFLLADNYLINPVLKSFFNNSIIFEFILGMLAFKIYKIRLMKKINNVVLLIISILSYFFMAYYEVIGTDIARVFIYGIPSLILILSVTALEETKFMENNSLTKILALIGNGSYAIYLSHLYVVLAIQRIGHEKLNLMDPTTPLGVAVTLFFSIIVGHILYTHVDKPLSGYFRKKLTKID
jgi:exopolysaccharide production protein ExoZ